MFKTLTTGLICLVLGMNLLGCSSSQVSFSPEEAIHSNHIELKKKGQIINQLQQTTIPLILGDYHGIGTVIYRNDQVYVLTVAHLIPVEGKWVIEPGDPMFSVNTSGKIVALVYIGLDVDLDLAVFQVTNNHEYWRDTAIDTFSSPRFGHDVWTFGVVGYPSFMSDGMVTFGPFDDGMFSSNVEGSFGSSGSGIYYKGTTEYIGMIQSKNSEYPQSMNFRSWNVINEWLEEMGL